MNRRRVLIVPKWYPWPDKPVWGYNGSGRTGAAMDIEKLLAEGLKGSIPQDSIHAVTVPGAVDAWETILKVHGRFGLDRALAPAIRPSAACRVNACPSSRSSNVPSRSPRNIVISAMTAASGPSGPSFGGSRLPQRPSSRKTGPRR